MLLRKINKKCMLMIIAATIIVGISISMGATFAHQLSLEETGDAEVEVVDSLGEDNNKETVTSPKYEFVHEISVVSQNLRVKSGNDGTDNTLEKRLERMKQLFQKYDTDIKCFQECSLDWQPIMGEFLNPNEYFIESMKTSVGHTNPIYAKKSKFNFIDSGSFQISEANPDDYNETRVASWILLQDKYTFKTLLMINTHLPVANSIQIPCCEKIIEFAKSKPAEGYLICGDFNFTRDGNKEAYNIMTGDTKDMALIAQNVGNLGGTFHNYGRKSPIRIDYFYGSDNLQSKLFSNLTDMYDGFYPSDHYGILNYITIE